jgi:hypothetical protein
MTQKTKNCLSSIFTTTLTTNTSTVNLKEQDLHTLADQLYNPYNLMSCDQALKSVQNGGGGGGIGAGYTDDFTPLYYFTNLLEGLRKIPPLKIVRFEHKIITLSSRHTW